jgi:hypothetical protein
MMQYIMVNNASDVTFLHAHFGSSLGAKGMVRFLGSVAGV